MDHIDNDKNHEFYEMLEEKDNLIRSLVERCERQEKKIAKMIVEANGKMQVETKSKIKLQSNEEAKRIPFSFFKPFIVQYNEPKQTSNILCLRVNPQTLKNKTPIWISPNLQLCSLPLSSKLNPAIENLELKQIGIQKIESKDNKFESQLSKEVEILKQNIGRCEHFIENWKELQEMNQIQKQQEEINISRNKPEDNHQKGEVKDQKVQQLEGQLFKLTKTNQKLRERIIELEEAEGHLLTTLRQLEEQKTKESKLFNQNLENIYNGSKLGQSDLKQKKMKTIRIGY